MIMSAGAIGGIGGMGGMGHMGGIGNTSGAVGSTPAAAGNTTPPGVSEAAPSTKVHISAAAEKALSAESAEAGASSTTAANVLKGTHAIADLGATNSKQSDFSVVTNLNVNVDIQNVNIGADGLNGNRFDDIVAALLIAMMMQQQEKRASFLSN
jgi:hypothetical protein